MWYILLLTSCNSWVSSEAENSTVWSWWKCQQFWGDTRMVNYVAFYFFVCFSIVYWYSCKSTDWHFTCALIHSEDIRPPITHTAWPWKHHTSIVPIVSKCADCIWLHLLFFHPVYYINWFGRRPSPCWEPNVMWCRLTHHDVPPFDDSRRSSGVWCSTSLPAVTQISPQRFDRGKNSVRRETQNTIVCRPQIETTPPLRATEGKAMVAECG